MSVKRPKGSLKGPSFKTPITSNTRVYKVTFSTRNGTKLKTIPLKISQDSSLKNVLRMLSDHGCYVRAGDIKLLNQGGTLWT